MKPFLGLMACSPRFKFVVEDVCKTSVWKLYLWKAKCKAKSLCSKCFNSAVSDLRSRKESSNRSSLWYCKIPKIQHSIGQHGILLKSYHLLLLLLWSILKAVSLKLILCHMFSLVLSIQDFHPRYIQIADH